MEIYQALKNDHNEVKAILNELVQLNDDDDYRYVLLGQIKTLLVPHSRAEEQVFYNAIRAVSPDKDIVRHSFKEHLEIETLLRSLELMSNLDKSWKGVAKKFKETLEHHVQEEETRIFLEARQIFSHDEAMKIGEIFEKVKPEVAKENFLETTFDMAVNMLPPRLSEGLKNLGAS